MLPVHGCQDDADADAMAGQAAAQPASLCLSTRPPSASARLGAIQSRAGPSHKAERADVSLEGWT